MVLTFKKLSDILITVGGVDMEYNDMEHGNGCLMLLKRLGNMLEKRLNQVVTELDLTVTQAGTLMTIFKSSEKQMPLKQLEKALDLSQSVTAGIVVRLEQKNLLESFGDISDKRIKIVKITPRGEELCYNAMNRLKTAEEEALSGLTETENAIFISLLKKAIVSMR